MPKAKVTMLNGKIAHYSVGALIERNGVYLLLDRARPPYGFAAPAGHVDEGETEDEALIREVKEETGFNVDKYKLILEDEIDWVACNQGADFHYWYLYDCNISGIMKRNPEEAKSIGWYSRDEIKKLELESVWDYYFKKLGIIDP